MSSKLELGNERTITMGAYHVKIMAKEDGYVVREIAFKSPRSQRYLDDELIWSAEEIRLAFNLEGHIAENHPEFANQLGAKIGITGKFIRNDEKLIIIGKDEEGQVQYTRVRLNKDIQRPITGFIG